LSETTEENVPGVLTSAVPEAKDLNAEAVTTMTAEFLKRIGHKGTLKPKRVSLEGDIYTVEVELKKFTATVKVDVKTQEIKEYDVQPKSEESSFSMFSLKSLMPMIVISSIVTVGLYFGLKMLGM
jgi:ABC-type Na+ efflux pump permease subunit